MPTIPATPALLRHIIWQVDLAPSNVDEILMKSNLSAIGAPTSNISRAAESTVLAPPSQVSDAYNRQVTKWDFTHRQDFVD